MRFRLLVCILFALSAALPNRPASAKGGGGSSSGGHSSSSGSHSSSSGKSSGSSSGKSSGSSSGKTVHVNSYTRKDGTVVRAYDRSAPGSGGARLTAPSVRTSAPQVRTTARGLSDDDDDDDGDTVYITKTGSKYHRKGCRYLKSSIPISLADAVARYSPCSSCHPPTALPSSKTEPQLAVAENGQKPAEVAETDGSALAAERLARQTAEAELAALRKQVAGSKNDPEREEKLAQSQFNLANELRLNGKDTAANRRFQELLKDHPNTEAAAAAAKILGVKPPLRPGDLRGKVVSIADGDTVTVLDSSNTQHKIRLQGIDAPEKKQAFGTKSKENLSEKIFGKQVLVKWKEKDKYGRLLGEIYLGERHINLEMVQDGMAWHYKKYSKDEELSAAEESARKEKRGLWADQDPIPPWDFRKSGKAESSWTWPVNLDCPVWA